MNLPSERRRWWWGGGGRFKGDDKEGLNLRSLTILWPFLNQKEEATLKERIKVKCCVCTHGQKQHSDLWEWQLLCGLFSFPPKSGPLTQDLQRASAVCLSVVAVQLGYSCGDFAYMDVVRFSSQLNCMQLLTGCEGIVQEDRYISCLGGKWGTHRAAKDWGFVLKLGFLNSQFV